MIFFGMSSYRLLELCYNFGRIKQVNHFRNHGCGSDTFFTDYGKLLEKLRNDKNLILDIHLFIVRLFFINFKRQVLKKVRGKCALYISTHISLLTI